MHVVRALVDGAHVVYRSGVRKVGGLGNGRIAVLLEGGLHADVVVRRNVVRRVEHPLPFARNFGVLHAASLRDALHELVAVPALGLRDGHEFFVHVGHHHACLIAHERHREQRLEPRAAPSDDGDGARGRDRGDVAVAQQLHGANSLPLRIARARFVGAEDAARPFGERAALLGQPLALLLALDIEELHHLAPHLHAFSTVVRNTQAHEHVGKTHHAEPDAADALAQRVDLRQRILVDVDDVVEEVRAERDVAAHRVPVHHAMVHVVPHVHAAEVAHVVRQQRLLTARVRCLVVAEVRHRVVAVGFVDEEHTGLTGAPRAEDHFVPYVARAELAAHQAVGRIHEIVAAVGLERLHELRGDTHRDVEVRNLGEVFLGGDELEHVGVIDAQDAHVGAATRAPLLYGVGAAVVELHEAHGAAGHTRRAAHHAPLGAQARKGEAGAAAALMDKRHAAQRVVDAALTVTERVIHRQYEAGGELTQRTAGVHQRGRVGLEPTLRHEEVELLGQRLHRSVARSVPAVGLGHHGGHTPEHVLDRLDRLAGRVLREVALLENRPRIGGQRDQTFRGHGREGHSMRLLGVWSGALCNRTADVRGDARRRARDVGGGSCGPLRCRRS